MRILINAGPTREYIDTVRFISNASSGQMGYAIARRATEAGHDVILVSGPVAIPPPDAVEFVSVLTADDMLHACRAAFDRCDAAVLTAAVCDYRPAERSDRKLKKTGTPRALKLVPTPDIAAALGADKGSRVVVGFALEDHDARAHAESKLRRKKFDAVVLNTPATLGAEDTTIEILTADGRWSNPVTGSKPDLATSILDLLGKLRKPE